VSVLKRLLFVLLFASLVVAQTPVPDALTESVETLGSTTEIGVDGFNQLLEDVFGSWISWFILGLSLFVLGISGVDRLRWIFTFLAVIGIVLVLYALYSSGFINLAVGDFLG